MSNTLFCPKCAETKEYLNGFTNMNKEHRDFIAGYLIGFGDKISSCPYCKNESLVSIPISNSDFNCIMEISNYNKEFLKAMIDLAENDPIEYQLKMSQFRSQAQQQEQIEQQREQQSKPHCPHCNSTNIKSLSGVNRGVSIAMWGIFSKKINKSFECLDCKYTW